MIYDLSINDRSRLMN